MIYRVETREIDGVAYITGYQMVSETGRPTKDNEVGSAPTGLMDGNGKLRLTMQPNPRFGATTEGGDVDDRRVLVVEREQGLSPEELATAAHQERRRKVAAALPDLLLAAADGMDIGAEVRKLLGGNP